MIPSALLCHFEAPTWLLFSSNIPPLIYYSHLPVILLSLVISIFIFSRNRRGLPNQIIFFTVLSFCSWVFLDSIFWASNRSDVIMFVWSLQILIEPLVHIGTFYLVYNLVLKQDVSFRTKVFWGLLYLPIIVLVPTKYILSGFDISTCLSSETLISYYTYVLEIFTTGCIIAFSVLRYLEAKSRDKKKEIVLIGLGAILFLLAFSWGAITGSFTEDWNLAQYGLFGMPVFIGFLAYTIVKFRTFNIKLIGAQVLVLALFGLIASILFITSVDYIRVVTAITLIPVFIFGLLLIRGVRREVEQRERIEKLAKELGAANERLKELDQLKSEFVSLATHQIRGPITAIKGYASLMLEGDYGAVPESIKQPIETIAQSSGALAGIVQDFLDVSRIEQGRMKYEFTAFDLSKLVYDVAEELSPTIERKGLKIKLDVQQSITVEADKGKLRQVIENLIDNALKYTPQGFIYLTLTRAEGNIARLTIKDTGVGIKKETLPKLFQKFSRAEDASKANMLGTGLGLYVARQLIEAQKGRVFAESEGEGKGSTFSVELPLKM
ncbi:MAG: hypothetical protein A2849_04265 [Candidatus Taylorbacteria bacterium RIFCSPHIGHO2_01_FULL_51_15]|uniref:histidine kinase n=1 Tax=Candidatus Taylorbacteria bacterium RIFCSPHIGHO2_01_FULL_51_15 TaxID=1802304 RepID=A0A1G2MAL7_9BACT|nr:MAG: hypothetical protein A2849_04265 [Candidatus Taylorbacteria bacterium RIFCSPHIGHO2_01_FULL_51_15]